MRRSQLLVTATLLAIASVPAFALEGRILVPYITGHPETHVFTGHPGWVDAYYPGYGGGISARIHQDGTFSLPDPEKEEPLCLIAMLDGIETPPIIVPNYGADGNTDVVIPTEYACVPDGYPEVWDREYLQQIHHWYQTFVPGGTQIYGCTIFDGSKAVKWGNKFNATLHEDESGKKPIFLLGAMGHSDYEGRNIDFLSGNHSDHEFGRVGWRHGDLEVVPGRSYAMCAGGYNSHGGEQVPLPAYIRPDNGDGYARGEAFSEHGHSGKTSPTGGDLSCLIFGNSHGQLVENQIRTEEWEIFIPPLVPSQNWGQSFLNHGTSLAGISFWASNGADTRFTCEVKVHNEEHPTGDPIKLVKIAGSHDSRIRPIIRYPDWPAPLDGYENYYALPADLFQVSYAPDELPLEKGKRYYIELAFSEPAALYVDGDYYADGYGHYEDMKLEGSRRGNTMHSKRWTLAVNIVTYANPGGAPLSE